MKAESNIQPSMPYEFEICGDNVNITFFDNIVEVEPVDETPRYTYDIYHMTVRNRPTLISDLDSNISMWILAARTAEYTQLATAIREKRDLLLSETDYLMTQDYPISVADRELMIAYRKALRDIPEQSGFPFDIIFPLKPNNKI